MDFVSGVTKFGYFETKSRPQPLATTAAVATADTTASRPPSGPSYNRSTHTCLNGGLSMFVDYLRLTFLIPHDKSERKGHGCTLAESYRTRALQGGELLIDGSHAQSFHDYPRGCLVKLDFSGSSLPIDIGDFFRRFARYNDWTISRIDLADNLPHLNRDMVRTGQSRHVNDWWETTGDGIRIWTGTGVGKRGRAGSYFRAYDARKHREGIASKISRFGTADFWRIEYELCREFFRRKGFDKFGELNEIVLADLWANESYKKGVFYDETSEYVDIRGENTAVVTARMKQESRVLLIGRMVPKLDALHLEAVRELLDQESASRAGLDKKPSKGIRLPGSRTLDGSFSH